MASAGYSVREHDPFEQRIDLNLPRGDLSPYAGRIRLLWQTMRQPVARIFPRPPALPRDVDAYVERVEEAYLTDAYHSLSIEGYRVSAELMDRVRAGAWDPDSEQRDREIDDALAARGYWQAFQAVEESVRHVLAGDNPGMVADREHGRWYRQMFAPRVAAGLVPATTLASYRDSQVYIRGSMHVPMPVQAVRDAMPVLFEMLDSEPEPSVRVVLGHFMFVYIHPYMDGNGRMGRFLMNVMLAAGGYPWTIVPLQRRAAYMAALADASVRQNIEPLATFLGELVSDAMAGKSAPSLPGAP